jgi:hypothetical protein
VTCHADGLSPQAANFPLKIFAARGMREKEYIIFCDESEKEGKYYSNFYGGLLVGTSQYERITKRLNTIKHELNLFGEVKWEKVTERYLPKYEILMQRFFEEVAGGNVKVRIMFRQNAFKPSGLTPKQMEMQYFLLYYQFIKHAFGLEFIAPSEYGTNLRLYFDQFPESRENVERFKGYLLALQKSKKFRATSLILRKENVAELKSHDHVLLQCLDVVLGAMAFRLNDKHKEKPVGKARRGKRTRAKEALYKTILHEIRKIHPHFNIGVTTSIGGDTRRRWEDSYLHWCFQPQAAEYEAGLTKRGRRKIKKPH